MISRRKSCRLRPSKQTVFETLENRLCFTGFSFTSHEVEPISLNQPTEIWMRDLDGDGSDDVLARSELNGPIGWFRNVNGTGTFGPMNVITSGEEDFSAFSVATGDFDTDGDLDIVMSDNGQRQIIWYENTDGQGDFSVRQDLKFDSAYFVSIVSADFDRDGDDDLLGINTDGEISWHENLDSRGNFAPAKLVGSGGRHARAGSLSVHDMNGDGMMDVTHVYYSGVTIYRNMGAESFSPIVIFEPHLSRDANAIVDFDLDNDLDVIVGHRSGQILWFENIGGDAMLSPAKQVASSARDLASIAVDDFDADGDMDFVSADRYETDIKVAVNQNGSFRSNIVTPLQFHGPNRVAKSDIDNDGDQDLVVAAFHDNRIAILENKTGRGDFEWKRDVVPPSLPVKTVKVTDLDSDGDSDFVVSTLDGRISWFENVDKAAAFVKRDTISESLGSVEVFTADIDNDGDHDVIASGRVIFWFENLDGRGEFGNRNQIGVGDFATIQPIDMDHDGDIDLFAFSERENRISWFRNENGEFESILVDEDRRGPESAIPIDIDEDGDIDVLAGKNGTRLDHLVMYENENGTFSDPKVISEYLRGTAITAADFDGDGDFDILSTNRIGIYELLNEGDGDFQFTNNIRRSRFSASIAVHDIDNDGDADVLAWATDCNNCKSVITWYENADGQGRSSQALVIDDNAAGSWSVDVGDFDQDGNFDIVAASQHSGQLIWYRGNISGDANGDRRFDNKDLILVFQASEFQDSVDGNSTFEEGDWNGDGDFDTKDLVAAFQKGHFVLENDAVAVVDSIFMLDELPISPVLPLQDGVLGNQLSES